MADHHRKWALITGVSPGGMGEAEASILSKRGINVIATGIDTQDLKYLEPEKGSGHGFVITLPMDVTSSESIATAVKQVEKLTDGKLDYLWNNAGYGYFTPLIDANIEQARKQYDVNVWGLLAVMQAFFPMLRAAKGTVINQASVSGLQNWNCPFQGIYSSSKAAVMSLSTTMRLELAPFDINVATLVTSAVKTEFHNHKSGAGISDSSPYVPIKAEAEEMMGSIEADRVGHDRYQVAESTVNELLKEPAPLIIRKGYMATFVAIMYWLLPSYMLDSEALRRSGLSKLKMLIRGDGDEKKEQ